MAAPRLVGDPDRSLEHRGVRISLISPLFFSAHDPVQRRLREAPLSQSSCERWSLAEPCGDSTSAPPALLSIPLSAFAAHTVCLVGPHRWILGVSAKHFGLLTTVEMLTCHSVHNPVTFRR